MFNRYVLTMILLCCSLLVKPNIINKEAEYATISGKAEFMKDGDSVFLYTYKYGRISGDKFSTKYASVVKKHQFSFRARIATGPIHFSIQYPSIPYPYQGVPSYKTAVDLYLLEKFDNIHVDFTKEGLVFSGRGCEKLNLQYEFARMFNDFSNLKINGEKRTVEYCKNLFEKCDSLKNLQIKHLDSKSGTLSNSVKDLFNANIVAYFEEILFNIFYFMPDSSQPRVLGKLNYQLSRISAELKDVYSRIKVENLVRSGLYPKAIIHNYILDSCFAKGIPFSLNKCFEFIQNEYTGLLKERLYVPLFFTFNTDVSLGLKNPEDISLALNTAIKGIKNQDFLLYLKSLQYSKFMIGAPAFNFSLTDMNGRVRKLSDFKGKAVLVDFWFTGCGNCVQLLPKLQKVEDRFNHRDDIVFLSVSNDVDNDTWKKSIAKGIYTTTNSINLYTGGRGANDLLYEKLGIDGAPIIVLIDKYGRLYKVTIDPRADEGKDLEEKINEMLLMK